MVNRLSEILQPLIQNPYIFVVSSLFVYLLGGFDDILLSLFVLNILDLILNLCSTKKTKVSTIIRMHIYIILAVLIDRTFNFEVELRQYVIMCCSYNEVTNILSKLSEDNNIRIPKKLQQIFKKFEE